MRRPRVRPLWGAFLLAFLACAAPRSAPPAVPPLPVAEPGARPERLVLVSIEGLVPGAYRPDASGRSDMPTLAGLAAAGVEADVVQPVAPASLYPAHATLVTGEPPARHGVSADHLLGERGVRRARYEHATALEAPTLWQRAREAGISVAALDWPSTLGAAIEFLVPDVTPVRRDQSWVELAARSATPPWLGERLRAGAGGAARLAAPRKDALLVGLACDALASPAPPGLLLLRLTQTGDALARSGPGSEGAREGFRAADAELARLLGCLDAGGALARSAVAVVGDRGTVAIHTLVQPNVVLARKGLVPSSDSVLSTWHAIARSNGGSAFVYARRERDALAARRVLEEVARETRAFRVVSAQEMLDGGADPEAWFGLEATPGYAFGDGVVGRLLEPAVERGASGYLPGRPEMRPAFVLWGRGARSGVKIPWMRQTDVAPTLAELLGTTLGSRDGRVLVGVLQAPAAVSAAPRGDG